MKILELITLTISQIHKGLRNKVFSAIELTQAYLGKIKKSDKDIGAFLSVNNELALSQAKQVDEAVAEGAQIPVLAGAPAAIKDNILIKDLKCTAGSKILQNYQAVYDAGCIKKLKDNQVVFLGKTNLDEFAMGSSCEHSAFKQTKNPHDLKRVPGGSSGGSAAAVAANQCVFALGSDTGGSIRQPASFCGVVGLKPTYGAVSRYGLIAFASSLDQIGPMAKTVGDCEIVFEAIKGRDEKDSTSIKSNPKSKILNPKQIQNSNFKIQNIKIGAPKEYFGEGLSRGVREVIESAIKKLESHGAKIEEISLPHSKYALACYYIIATSEVSANLARYDGIRYGNKVQSSKFKVQSLLSDYLKTRAMGFGDEVKRRIMLGTFSLSSGYYDAYYSKAQKVRTLIGQDFVQAFKKVDFILGPVSPFLAFKIGEKLDDPLQMYLSDIYTVSVNLAGLPAISLPVGKAGDPVKSAKSGAKQSNRAGLPVGLQIIGNYFTEPAIFALGKLIETF